MGFNSGFKSLIHRNFSKCSLSNVKLCAHSKKFADPSNDLKEINLEENDSIIK